MKRSILETKAQIEDFARRLEIPMAGKIKNLGELFRALDIRQTPDAKDAAKMLREVLKKQANLVDSYQMMLNELPPAPAAPLKGRNYRRNTWYGSQFLDVPNAHHGTVTQTAEGRGLKTSMIISPEAWEIVNRFENKMNAARLPFHRWQTTREHAIAVAKKREMQQTYAETRAKLHSTKDEKWAVGAFYDLLEGGTAPYWAAMHHLPEKYAQIVDDKRRQFNMTWTEFAALVQKVFVHTPIITTEQPVNPAI